MELSDLVWRTSTRSGPNGGECVEPAVIWRKSTRSTANGGDCVELAAAHGVIAIRDSKNPDAGHLAISREAFRGLVDEIKTGVLAR